MSEETRVVADTAKRVHPKEVGELFSKKIGTREAEARNRRIRFRVARRRMGSDELLLLSLEAISVILMEFKFLVCFF